MQETPIHLARTRSQSQAPVINYCRFLVNVRQQKSRKLANPITATKKWYLSNNGNISSYFINRKESFSTEMTSKQGETAILFRTGEYAVAVKPTRPTATIFESDNVSVR